MRKKRILVLFGLSGERYEEAKERGLTLCIFMRKLSEEQDGSVDITIAAIMAERFHLFPYRTQKLSFLTPKVLVGTLTGRIGHRHFPSFCRLLDKNNRKYCSLAQSVEHRTVNPSVVSSSLTGAAIYVDRNY